MGFPRRNVARPSLRRGMVALVAGALAMPAAMLPAVPATAVGPIALISSSQWFESLGTSQAVHIVGQIRNTSGGNVAYVRVGFDWIDVNGAVVGHSWAIATKKILKDQDYSPFEDVEFPRANLNYDHFLVGAITPGVSDSQPYHLDVSSDPCPAGDPADEVCGTATNNGPLTVYGITAILSYQSGGLTVGQDTSVVDNDLGGSAFAPSNKGHFKFRRSDGHSPVTITADGEPTYSVDLNPSPLDIGRVNVGKTGQQDVTVYNNGPQPVKVSAVQAVPSAEFTATSDCPSTGLGAGLSCHVAVRLTPAAKGARSGTLTITDDAAGSPQTVALTGTGTAPQVAFVPASTLDFGSSVRAGTPGMLKAATLVNSGDGPLTITSMTSDDPADFKVDGSACPIAPYTLAPGGQCPIGVTFVAGIAGPYGMNVPHTNLVAANLVVVDDAGTQKLSLSGIAAGPGAQLTVGNVVVAGVDFGQQPLNAPSLPAVVTLTNNGTEPLVISKIALTGDFSETDTCGALPATIAAGASCTLSIRFTPSQAGKRSGGITITDNAANFQQSITLAGAGFSDSGRRQGSGVHRELLVGPIVAIPVQP